MKPNKIFLPSLACALLAGGALADDMDTAASPAPAAAPADTITPAADATANSGTAAQLIFFSQSLDIGGRKGVYVLFKIGEDGDENNLFEVLALGKIDSEQRGATLANRLNQAYDLHPDWFKQLVKKRVSVTPYPVIGVTQNNQPLITVDPSFAKLCDTDIDGAVQWLISQLKDTVNGKSRDFKPISTMKPDEKLKLAIGYRQNGDSAYAAGRMSEAELRYQTSLELNPHNVYVMLSLSSTFMKEGKKADARQYLDKATASKPDADQQSLIAQMTKQLG